MDALLYDLPPPLMEQLCRVMDTGGDLLGWRGLAVRVVTDYTEVRRLERLEAAGRSPSRELLWSWAQQNTRVRDLLLVLQDMGHWRALQLLQGPTPAAAPQQQRHPQVEGDRSTPPGENWVWGAGHRPPVLTLRDVIRDLHPGTKISEKDFTDVHRVQVGGQSYAVKMFKQVQSLSWRQRWDDFLKEVEVQRLHQHPNILDLTACFSDQVIYCLVSPYLSHGSLHHRLHQQEGTAPLTWEQRLAVIKGVAKALHHLHTAPPTPLICGNISSSNVLLDDALQPRLSDVGVARLRPGPPPQGCSTTTVSRGVGSSQGYLPEEFIRHQRPTSSLDVYSFGMVVMETVTGRQVVQYEPKQTLLRDLLDAALDHSGGSVDSCLQFLDQSAGQWPTDVARSLLALALECTAGRHSQRPCMEDVLLSLSRLLPPPRGPPPAPPSLPVEHDEESAPPGLLAQVAPLECSQSEVTFLSCGGGPYPEVELDLYGSCPVQCGCSAEDGGGPCEDCRADTLTSDAERSFNADRVVENEAKSKLRNKLSLYNRRMIDTPELFSETDGHE